MRHFTITYGILLFSGKMQRQKKTCYFGLGNTRPGPVVFSFSPLPFILLLGFFFLPRGSSLMWSIKLGAHPNAWHLWWAFASGTHDHVPFFLPFFHMIFMFLLSITKKNLPDQENHITLYYCRVMAYHEHMNNAVQLLVNWLTIHSRGLLRDDCPLLPVKHTGWCRIDVRQGGILRLHIQLQCCPVREYSTNHYRTSIAPMFSLQRILPVQYLRYHEIAISIIPHKRTWLSADT